MSGHGVEWNHRQAGVPWACFYLFSSICRFIDSFVLKKLGNMFCVWKDMRLKGKEGTRSYRGLFDVPQSYSLSLGIGSHWRSSSQLGNCVWARPPGGLCAGWVWVGVVGKGYGIGRFQGDFCERINPEPGWCRSAIRSCLEDELAVHVMIDCGKREEEYKMTPRFLFLLAPPAETEYRRISRLGLGRWLAQLTAAVFENVKYWRRKCGAEIHLIMAVKQEVGQPGGDVKLSKSKGEGLG